MSFAFWLVLILSAAIIVGAMVAISTFYKEDEIWRILISGLLVIVVLIIFAGAYFAGENGLWWMWIPFAVVAFFTVYHLLEPD